MMAPTKKGGGNLAGDFLDTALLVLSPWKMGKY